MCNRWVLFKVRHLGFDRVKRTRSVTHMVLVMLLSNKLTAKTLPTEGWTNANSSHVCFAPFATWRFGLPPPRLPTLKGVTIHAYPRVKLTLAGTESRYRRLGTPSCGFVVLLELR